jgi:hypothetical protein
MARVVWRAKDRHDARSTRAAQGPVIDMVKHGRSMLRRGGHCAAL